MNFSKVLKVKAIVIALFYSVFAFSTESSVEFNTALTIKSIYSPDRLKSIDVYYWYPTKEENDNFNFGNNKIFHSTKAVQDAEIAPSKHPVIVLSHGGTKSAFTHTGWIASALTKRGYIVVVPKPPEPSEIKPHLAINELSYRPSDIVLALSSLETVGLINQSADLNKVYGVGFFLGGTSMLNLVGAKLDPKKYQESCTSEGINVDCAWLKRNNVNLIYSDENLISDTKTDQRFKSVVIINPELTKVLEANSLKNIASKVTLINLLAERNPALKPAESISNIPDLSLVNVESARAFSTFGICTKKGVHILALDGDDVICHEPPKMNRQENHQKIIDEILLSLDKSA